TVSVPSAFAAASSAGSSHGRDCGALCPWAEARPSERAKPARAARRDAVVTKPLNGCLLWARCPPPQRILPGGLAGRRRGRILLAFPPVVRSRIAAYPKAVELTNRAHCRHGDRFRLHAEVQGHLEAEAEPIRRSARAKQGVEELLEAPFLV